MPDADPNSKYIQPLGFYIGTADSSRTHRYGILFAMLGSTLLVNFFSPASSLIALVAFFLLTGLYLIAILAVKRGDVVRAVIEDLEGKLGIISSYPPASFFDTKFTIAFLYSASIAEIAGYETQLIHGSGPLIAFVSFIVALAISLTIAKRI